MDTNWIRTSGGFRYAGQSIEATMTEGGAQLAPVTFGLDTKPFNPYFVSPWQGENLPMEPGVLRSLRGNFFCLPFGAGGLSDDDRVFRAHGEVASEPWTFEYADRTASGDRIVLSIKPRDIGGMVLKTVEIDEAASTIFTEVTVEGALGNYPVGYHPNLRMPFAGRMYLSLSPWETVRVMPRTALQYKPAEYYDLLPGIRAASLTRVPTLAGSFSDCTVFPRVEGFVDIVAAWRCPSDELAWSFAAYPEEGYAWYSLKSSRRFGSTLLWMENRGRHQFPWNGRTSVLGVEDVTSYFADTVGTSQGPNDMNALGYPTCHTFRPEETSRFPYLEGIVAIPSGFSRIAQAGPTRSGFSFTSTKGQTVEIVADLSRL